MQFIQLLLISFHDIFELLFDFEDFIGKADLFLIKIMAELIVSRQL